MQNTASDLAHKSPTLKRTLSQGKGLAEKGGTFWAFWDYTQVGRLEWGGAV